MTGVLRGERLAQAFAGMDLFVFPSQTDAFGNVVLEAMAAGVPSVVMPKGGPKFLVENGVTGFAAKNEREFIETVIECAKEPSRIKEMRTACRASACKYSWEQIFENVYDKYRIVGTLNRNVKAQENL